MKSKKNRTFFIIMIVSYLTISYIINGMTNNWSLIYLLKDNWGALLGLFVGYCLLDYVSSQK